MRAQRCAAVAAGAHELLMNHSETCEAIILRYTNYAEADRIVALLTQDRGLCSAFARGARNSRRRFGGVLQPCNRIRIHWQKRKAGGMPQLGEVELLEGSSALSSNLDALAVAAYGCELVAALLPEEQAVPEVYRLLQAFLGQVMTGQQLPAARLLLELRLLNAVGVLPHLGHCAHCWHSLDAERLLFDGRRGGTLCSACASDSHGVQVAAQTLGSLVRLLKLDAGRFAQIQLSAQTLEEGGMLVRQVLHDCLGRTLKSEQFLQQLQSL